MCAKTKDHFEGDSVRCMLEQGQNKERYNMYLYNHRSSQFHHCFKTFMFVVLCCKEEGENKSTSVLGYFKK